MWLQRFCTVEAEAFSQVILESKPAMTAAEFLSDICAKNY